MTTPVLRCDVTDTHVNSLKEYGICVVEDHSRNVFSQPDSVGEKRCLCHGDKKYICRVIAVQVASIDITYKGLPLTYLMYQLIDIQ